jgi:drug/metabolite transporter (DMT)-like permease
MLTLNQIVLLVVYAGCLSAGQLVFKLASEAVVGLSLAESLPRLLLTPAFYVACLFYVLATFLWVWLLSRIPLSQAYPFVMLALIFVPLLNWYFFAEVPSLTYWLGVGLVVSGLVVIASAGPAFALR